jgi:hypothetical protein
VQQQYREFLHFDVSKKDFCRAYPMTPRCILLSAPTHFLGTLGDGISRLKPGGCNFTSRGEEVTPSRVSRKRMESVSSEAPVFMLIVEKQITSCYESIGIPEWDEECFVLMKPEVEKIMLT